MVRGVSEKTLRARRRVEADSRNQKAGEKRAEADRKRAGSGQKRAEEGGKQVESRRQAESGGTISSN
jgi:hypothetical protein